MAGGIDASSILRQKAIAAVGVIVWASGSGKAMVPWQAGLSTALMYQ
jgi:hypothetical protein